MNHTTLSPLCVAALAATVSAQTWIELTPNPFPNTTQVRRQGAIAFHPVQGGLVTYGGLQSTPTAVLDDTWSFDGTTWTLLTPATTPPPRWGHRMVYDSRRARIVTFGGRSPTTTATANDTWEWNGVDWQQVVTANAPSPRAFYSMAYDSRRGVTVLYGTQSGSTIGTSGGDQTWEYDGTNWTQAITATTPPGLEAPAMAYDAARGVTVMFGGWNGTPPGTDYRTTYEYDGVDWRLVPTANAPLTGYRAGCVYDEARGRVVVYGGYANATAQTTTWEYDGNDWTAVTTGGSLRITEAYMGYNPINRTTVYFGGSGPGTNPINSTWVYAGASTAIAAPFGRGCATSAGVPVLSPTNRPVLGNLYQLDLTGAPTSSFGVFMHGLSNSTWALGDLPADLGPFGLGGCGLEVSPDASVFVVFPNGSGSQSLSMPASTAFLDIAIFSQAFVLDVAAPNGVGGASNAVHGRLGL